LSPLLPGKTREVVWSGNDALGGLLAPHEQLRPHPRNPRRGVVAEIAASLRRFGQQRPVLARADGTLVAGHHVWRAAGAEGWTHVAVVRTELPEEEVDAYLLADNRLADLGLYDDRTLAEVLRPLAEAGTLEGTGYSADDVMSLLAFTLEPAELEQAQRALAPAESPYATGTASEFRIVLSYEQATYERVLDRLEELAREGESQSETVARLALA
jgi:ParB-like chromosome segregation protein Spo0J